jgi:hypothetical protein
VELELPFASLARLSALTHCSISVRRTSARSCSSLLATLASMQSLNSLELGGKEAWPLLLPLLCADAAALLLLRLKSLVLPQSIGYDDSTERLHNAFLWRLSSLSAPPALQHFSGVRDLSHCAASLLFVFSLPHLTGLRLEGYVQRSEFLDFTSSFTCPPAPLVSLVFPHILNERDDNRKGVAGA